MGIKKGHPVRTCVVYWRGVFFERDGAASDTERVRGREGDGLKGPFGGGHLEVVHIVEVAALVGKEFLWRPLLCGFAVFYHDNLVGTGDGSHSMGDDYYGLVLD